MLLIYLLAHLKLILFATFEYVIVKTVLNDKSVFTLPCYLKDVKGLIDTVIMKFHFLLTCYLGNVSALPSMKTFRHCLNVSALPSMKTGQTETNKFKLNFVSFQGNIIFMQRHILC